MRDLLEVYTTVVRATSALPAGAKPGDWLAIDGDKISIPGPRLVESAREVLDLLKQGN